MRALIVGCGYVGLPLGEELVRLGHEVTGLRRSASAEPELRSAGIEPFIADLTHPDDLKGLSGPFDWIVNCVASTGGGAEDYRRVYLQGTRNLLDWLAPAPPQKLIYTSSTSVYGQNDGSPVTENSPTEPLAETAQTLVETEQLLLEAAGRMNFAAVILRLAGIYGPNRGHWFRQFLKNEARLEGSGGRFLNMIHREDVVGAILAALTRGRAGERYNVVDDEPVTQRDFFGWLAQTYGRPLPPSFPEDPGARKRGATNKKVLNQKLKSELDYHFKFPDFRRGYEAERRRLDLARESEPGPNVN